MCEFADLIGKPYKKNGRGPDDYDCYGVPLEMSKRMGIPLPDVVTDSLAIELSAEYAPLLNLVKIEEPVEGCLIEMEFENELHLGIAINKKEMIHATKTGVRINKIGSLKTRGFYLWG